MLDSCEGKGPLVKANFVRAFVAECAVLAAGVTDTDCARIVDEVATGFGPSRRSCPSRRSYLRGARRRYRPYKDWSYHVSNVLKCETFHRFLLSTKYKGNDDLPEVLPLIPKASPSGEEEYRTILASITSRSDWLAPGAMLGRPFGRPFPTSANCWLSTDRFGPDDEAPNYGNDTATKARDELGLIDYAKDTYLNQIRVPEAALTKLPNIKMARPVFSDCGSSRFMVRQQSTRATLYAEAGWGTAVHLGKVRADPMGNVTGAPERVAPPLPLNEIDSFEVDLLGRVSACPDHTGCHNPEKGYDLRLMSVTATDNLPNDGCNLVIVALVGSDLHIRIFDVSGNKVVEGREGVT